MCCISKPSSHISARQVCFLKLDPPTLHPFPHRRLLLAGIPIRLGIGTPVCLGFDASVSGALHLTADMGMSATMKSGFVYTGGNINFINDLSFTESGSGVNLVKVDDISATIRFFLLPIPSLNVDYMGGPTVGLKTYVEAVVDIDQTASKTCNTGPSVVTNVGLDGTIGADLHIGLAGKNLYNKKSAIHVSCLLALCLQFFIWHTKNFT